MSRYFLAVFILFSFLLISSCSKGKVISTPPTPQGQVTDDDAKNICEASGKGDLPVVKALLNKSPELVKARYEFLSQTPLHYAAMGGHKEVAEVLIASGSEIDAKDAAGSTPLTYAVMMQKKDLIVLFISKGANPEIKNNKDDSPLSLSEKNKDINKLLIETAKSSKIKNK